jgi:hypothetical protein
LDPTVTLWYRQSAHLSDESLLDAVRALEAKILADLTNTPQRFARMADAQREGRLLHADRPICPFLRPYILRRPEYDTISKAAATVAGALERLTRRRAAR